MAPAPLATFAQPHQWNPFRNSLNSSLTIKLNCMNFLSWKSQVICTVIGHSLDDILLIGVASVEHLVTGDLNLEFTIWQTKDQLLLSWLRSFMFETILGSLAQHNTSFTAWKALEK